MANTLLLTFFREYLRLFPICAVTNGRAFHQFVFGISNHHEKPRASLPLLNPPTGPRFGYGLGRGSLRRWRGSPDLHQRHGGRANRSRRLRPRGYRQQRACAAVPAAGGDRTSRGVCSPFAHLYVCAAGPCQELVQALRALLCLRSARVFREGAPAPARQIPR